MLAIARALMAAPELLMLDEPSLGLAPLIVRKVYEVIAEMRKSGVTVLVVEQAVHVALTASDRTYVMNAGAIVMAGRRRSCAARRNSRTPISGRGRDDPGPERHRRHQPGRHLCARRPGGRAHLQHHAADQLRPWRADHGRRIQPLCPDRRALHRHGGGGDPDGHRAGAGHGARRLPPLARGQSGDSAHRLLRPVLSAAAQRAAHLRLARHGLRFPRRAQPEHRDRQPQGAGAGDRRGGRDRLAAAAPHLFFKRSAIGIQMRAARRISTWRGSSASAPTG